MKLAAIVFVMAFADDFESYGKATDIGRRWDNLYQNQYVAIATTAANVYAGKQALEFTLPKQTAELSDAVEKQVSPKLDVLFLRYYSKFQPPYDVVGSSHNGSSRKRPQGAAVIRSARGGRPSPVGRRRVG